MCKNVLKFCLSLIAVPLPTVERLTYPLFANSTQVECGFFQYLGTTKQTFILQPGLTMYNWKKPNSQRVVSERGRVKKTNCSEVTNREQYQGLMEHEFHSH